MFKKLSPTEQVFAWMKATLKSDMTPSEKEDACKKKLKEMAWRLNNAQLPKRNFTEDDWHPSYPRKDAKNVQEEIPLPISAKVYVPPALRTHVEGLPN